MSEWRPIETAPRDGTALLLFVPGMTCWNRKGGMPDIVVGLWAETHFSTLQDGAWVNGGWYSDVGDIDEGYESTGAYFEHERLSPTHWMPLPKPPENAS